MMYKIANKVINTNKVVYVDDIQMEGDYSNMWFASVIICCILSKPFGLQFDALKSEKTEEQFIKDVQNEINDFIKACENIKPC